VHWAVLYKISGVKYDIFLQNNKFIPHVVSDKILKLQHQKELVLEAMQLFLSETVEAFVGKFGCALVSSLQNIWF
jgi:hypothetical protein